MRVPEVLALTRHDRPRSNSAPSAERNVFKRDHATCQYCGARPGTNELTIDHVLPRAQGGLTTWENCVLACVACNARKANRTPEQVGMETPGIRPFRPSWKPLYDSTTVRLTSWSRFLSEAYWSVTLGRLTRTVRNAEFSSAGGSDGRRSAWRTRCDSSE